ncbi:SDR family NAD(P)-dependent oxidoreductase [Microbacterium enclense]|uniref:SDR family NAD(P)-dependent oxidoreductase n=1 Tax=Microbacterium enclense TaxID=993073 RepID=A0A3S3LUP6_9MICO|nr:SDR family NAD(P)-dependent oxidoreductase [Microbacterium enclense]RWR17775.1 SDR family NAD(P)-dependent oxidoreductase [Microbacterium enclense]
MTDRRVALITGANQGMGKAVARELAANGHVVYLGSRDLRKGERAAVEVGPKAVAVQLDVTDERSLTAAADVIGHAYGRLDVLINNAATASSREAADIAALREMTRPSVVPIDEVRAVWEVNVLGPLAVFQAMLPLLRASEDARVVNVTSGLGSLAAAADPNSGWRQMFDPVYAASKTALNALSLAMSIEMEGSPVKVNLVSPGFANTALVRFQGTDTVEDAAREIVRVARAGADVPGETFTTWPGVPLPW